LESSKPIAGLLSTGQRYLIWSISADGGKRRSPLTIAELAVIPAVAALGE